MKTSNNNASCDAFGLLFERSDCYEVEKIESMLAAGEHVLAHEARTRLYAEIEARAAAVVLDRHEYEVRRLANSYMSNLAEYIAMLANPRAEKEN